MSRKGKRDADRRKRIQAAAARRADADKEQSTGFRAAAGIPVVFEASGETKDGKPKLAKFTMEAYSGAPMNPQGWWDPIVVDLDGVKIPSQHRPILRQHDHNMIVGHSEEIKVDSKGIHVAGVISNPNAEWSKEIIDLSSNKFQWQASIGANPIRTEFLKSGEKTTVNGREVSGPLTISRETVIGEISFVPLGADGDTSATVNASARRNNVNPKVALKFALSLMQAAKYSDEDVDAMTDEEAKAALKKCMKAEDDPPGKSADDEPDEDDKKEKAEASAMAAFKAQMKKDQAAFLNEMRLARGAELTRQTEITATVERHGIKGLIPLTEKGQIVKAADGKPQMIDLAAHAIANGWDVMRVENAAMLETIRASRAGDGVGVPGGLAYSTSQPEVTGAVLEAAVFDALRGQFKLFDDDFYQMGEDGKRRIPVSEQRRIKAELDARYTDQVRQAAHTRFGRGGGIGLKQLLTICARGGGYRGPENFTSGDWGDVANGLAQSSIRADGPSSVNTPATLANVQNKFMLQGYMFTEQVYLEIANVLSVKDLKPSKSVQLFGDFQFQQLKPGGEIQHASMGDNPYANQAKLYSRMITLELQYLINDDLNMFGQVPMMLGRGWGLAVNDAFWTSFMNPGYDDGGSTNFYAATHTITGQSGNSNYSSGATTTLTSEGLRLANVLFANQVDPAGKPLGIDPELLIYPPELDNAALELMNAQFIIMAGLASTSSASKQPNTNIWKGRYKPLMSRYLNKAAYTGSSTTAWYLLANPSIIPVIQIAALNGQMTPMIQTAGQDWQFNTLGITMRGWGGFGVNPQNFRGAVKSAGA